MKMEIGTRIANLRKNKKMTQQDLASYLCVADKTISSWELNRTEPCLEDIVKLSKVLDCNASYLIYGDIKRKDIETEIKIKLTKEEYQVLEKKMEELAQFIKKSHQLDTYYEPAYRKFVKGKDEVIDEWLRIGKRGKRNILTYKHWYDIHCDEYEVEIDNLENMDKIFKILGLEEIATVDKIRTTYLYQDKYEIALDYVERLGYFVEIEVKEYTKSIMEEYDLLLHTAKDLGLNLNYIDRRGYPYYLIKMK